MGVEKLIIMGLAVLITLFNLYCNRSFAMDPLMSSIRTSSSALKAQSMRLKVISQNIANEDSTSNEKGGEPYRRKTITFKSKIDPRTGVEKIDIIKIGVDNKTDFKKKYEPSHPAADDAGYVLYPNVDKSLEFIDAKEAQRSYEANLNSISISNSMMSKTLEILR
jgi:flagellar basal-body rod protein FlgC